MKRKGLGIGKGRGYYNIMPMDSHIHSLSAKGVKTKSVTVPMTWDSVATIYCPYCGEPKRVEPDANYEIKCESCKKKYQVHSLIAKGWKKTKDIPNYKMWESPNYTIQMWINPYEVAIHSIKNGIPQKNIAHRTFDTEKEALKFIEDFKKKHYKLDAKGWKNLRFETPKVKKGEVWEKKISYKRGDGSTAKLDLKLENIGKPTKEQKHRDPDKEYWLEIEGKGHGSSTTHKSPKEALAYVDDFIDKTKGISDDEEVDINNYLCDNYQGDLMDFQAELEKLASNPKNAGGTCILGQGIEIKKHGTTVFRLPYSCFQSDMADSTVQPLMDKMEKKFKKDKKLKDIYVYHNEGRMD